MLQKYGITNFAYGTGPYLRTTELLIEFNNELEKTAGYRLPFIIPWVYGEKQKRIMLEEFSGHNKKYPGELLLAGDLGKILSTVFYGNNTYEQSLSLWGISVKEISEQANQYLRGKIVIETMEGEEKVINGRNIVIELNRSPRIKYGICDSYCTSFGYIEDVLSNVLEVSPEKIDINRELVKAGISSAHFSESGHKLYFMAYPATFSAYDNYKPRYKNEIMVPPITSLPKISPDTTINIEPGIYVTVTGISGLEKIYQEAKNLNLKLYCNDTEAVPGSIKYLPHIISNKNIIFQFARSGWGSVWHSMFAETLLVVPEHNPLDDPEIYFNNLAIEELGMGVIYRGQPLEEILEQEEKIKGNYIKIKQSILERWGTIDGNKVCAKIIADNFLK